MPIEELFSKVKSFLRANDPYIQIANESEIKDVIFAAFASISYIKRLLQLVEHC